MANIYQRKKRIRDFLIENCSISEAVSPVTKPVMTTEELERFAEEIAKLTSNFKKKGSNK